MKVHKPSLLEIAKQREFQDFTKNQEQKQKSDPCHILFGGRAFFSRTAET